MASYPNLRHRDSRPTTVGNWRALAHKRVADSTAAGCIRVATSELAALHRSTMGAVQLSRSGTVV